MKKSLLIVGLVTVVLICSAVWIEGAERGATARKTGVQNSTLGVPVSTMLNINRVAAWYSANGEQERIPSTGNSGLYYPRGTSTAIYSAGLVWGGLFNDGITPTLRVNGQSYNNGTKPGAILGIRTGVAEDPAAPDVRIWRIRRDYATADLKQDASEINSVGLNNVSDAQIAAVRAQYEKDWAEWPWQKGAPFYDNGYLAANGTDTVGRDNNVLDWGEDGNKNGVLDPGEDANGNNKLDGEAPGLADADQVIWYVCNDIGVAQPWTCPESGMEEQTTIWGYARTDAIGNVIFKRFRLIYKGTASTPPNATIDDMYLCQWSDPDLGDAGDDFAGCDTALSMSYVYNANPADGNYTQFRLVPPASGYDFLQGPLVSGLAGQDRNKNGVPDNQDYAIFNLKRVGPGLINLPMTSSLYFAAGGRYSDPPFSYNGAVQWYQMLRGLPPTPQGPPDPAPIVNPVTGQPTGFWLSGDPVSGSGWLDGTLDNPGDRRILLSSGPFTMALGDTQELVSAWVGGLGNSNISSIRVMKFNDKSVQLAYDNLFSLPKPPVNPKVVATSLDQAIILDWSLDSTAVAETEVPVYIGGYQFEGYKVYQLPSASSDLSSATLLAAYDLNNGVRTIIQETFDERSGEVLNLPVQFGTDNGVRRFYTTAEDKIRGGPLVNGQRYYFAVTTYNYTADENKPIRTLESAPLVLTVIPETPRPGTRYAYDIGDTVAVANKVGANDAIVRPIIYNPASQVGNEYELSFSSSGNSFVWSLKNTKTGKLLYDRVTDLAGEVPYAVGESGLNLFVASPPQGFISIRDSRGANALGPSANISGYSLLSTTGTSSGILGRGRTGRNYELRFDANTPSYAVRVLGIQRVPVRVPFSVWDMGRQSTDVPRQVIPAFKDTTGPTGGWDIKPGGVTLGGVAYQVFDPLYISDFSYPTSSDTTAVKSGISSRAGLVSSIINNQSADSCAVWNLFLADRNSTGAPPPNGTTILFEKYKELKHGDVKSIVPRLVTIKDKTLAKDDVSQIRAFPNPYYGLNRAETDRINRFVTFSHLPDRATLRIFNLAGVLVRVLEKDDPTQFLNWDLQNVTGLPVASGIYVVYVEMPDLNVTKTLKVAIIQEQQFLRNY